MFLPRFGASSIQFSQIRGKLSKPQLPPELDDGGTICGLCANFDQNQKNFDTSVGGGFTVLLSGQVLNSGSPINNVPFGISRVCLAALAGSDFSGSITLSGTTVDRDTRVETPADSEVIPISALTVDGSSVDSNGNVVHDFTDLYMSSKWFKGDVNITTTDVDLSDVDIFAIAFDQVDDNSRKIVGTFNTTTDITNDSAFLDEYLYAVVFVDNKVRLRKISEHHIAAGSPVSKYRLRENGLNEILLQSDGVFVDIHFGPAAQKYFENYRMDVYMHVAFE